MNDSIFAYRYCFSNKSLPQPFTIFIDHWLYYDGVNGNTRCASAEILLAMSSSLFSHMVDEESAFVVGYDGKKAA